MKKNTVTDENAETKRKVRRVLLGARLNDIGLYLSAFGRYIILVFVGLARSAGRGIAKLARFVWSRSGRLTNALMKKIGYFLVLIVSPFVGLVHSFKRARQDIRANRRKKGVLAAVGSALGHFWSFLFGSNGVAVTVFNIAAPIVCVVFLFNIVSYASNLTYCVKLTVNGKTLGYIENEQVYYDADEILKERINYLGSDENIRLEPTFAIELSGEGDPLTKYQVADLILEYSGVSVEYAYGFFMNGVFQGAVPDNRPIHDALDSLMDKYQSAHPNAEITFRDTLEFDTAGLYLSGSIIDTNWLISQLTSVKASAGYYIATAEDTIDTIVENTGLTIHQLDLLNTGFSDSEPHEGQRIKIRDEIPFLSVNISVTEEYDVEVPYTTEYYNDDTLYSGVTRVTTEGANGVNHLTAYVTYVNNIEVSRRVTAAKVISAPVTERIASGIKTPPEQYSSSEAGYGKFIWPMEVGKSHISELTVWDGGYAGHYGIDITAYYGAPIYAGASGTVIVAGRNYGYGNCVIIDHGNGFQTLYGHCSTLAVTVGEQVIQGQLIAYEGSSGIVTGPHLHFEVRGGSLKYNPLDYLEHVYY
ncbi:MAG: peptidoglycan DD-metalloendopeptidase family protein [Ruminiclostridium sp.]|nr:peptidoglycan DD-metalloendopeptidase family protein [Ruminiclostridium sp.]